MWGSPALGAIVGGLRGFSRRGRRSYRDIALQGNPLADISCLLGQGENILSIMKDGKFYKQGLPA